MAAAKPNAFGVSVSVVLISAPHVLRLGLVQVLRGFAAVRLIAVADDMAAARELTAALAPDIFVVVGAEPFDAGTGAAARKAFHVVRLCDAMAASDGETVLPSDLTPAMLCAALMPLRSGTLPVTQDMQPREAMAMQHVPVLGRQQRQILALMTRGMTNREIAQMLGLSLANARYHVGAILGKLDVTNRTEASSLAISMGLVSNDDL